MMSLPLMLTSNYSLLPAGPGGCANRESVGSSLYVEER